MTTYTLHTTLPCQAAITKALLNAGDDPVCTLGLDIELNTPAGALIIGGGTPLALGKHTRPVWLALARWLVAQGCNVHVVQEACGFGWQFHRDLAAAGAHSSVVAPEQINGKRKTDARDARTLASLLWDYEVRGNKQSLRPVRAPTGEEQQRRGHTRNRSQWQGLRAQMEAQGRSLMWDHSWLEVPSGWWRASVWKELNALLAKAGEDWLLKMLTPMQAMCKQLQERVDELEEEAVSQQQNTPQEPSRPQEAMKRPSPPADQSVASNSDQGSDSKATGLQQQIKGFGSLSHATIDSEVIDWHRFKNRGQAGSFIGCCPSEHSSGGRQKLGEIDRMGSARLRTLLVEAAWRLVRHNPGWRGFKKFGDVLQPGSKASGARRRKAIVACARLLMIDLWRLHTGTATLEGLGLKAATN